MAHPAIATAFLATEAVLYDERTGQTSVLNAAATAVWLVIDGERDVGEIVTEVAGDFGDSPEEIRADVEAVLADFTQRGLLEGAETTARACC